jgi:hypothetical protein
MRVLRKIMGYRKGFISGMGENKRKKDFLFKKKGWKEGKSHGGHDAFKLYKRRVVKDAGSEFCGFLIHLKWFSWLFRTSLLNFSLAMKD